MAKILFAEDDEDFALGIMQWLSLDKYLVEHTDDGCVAIQFLQTYSFDAAILDWDLPGMTGIDICKNLRKGNNNMPVVMLTAKCTTDDTVQGMESGADDYLTKPVEPRILLAKLKALLRRADNRTGETMQVRNICIDLKTHRVTREGAVIDLLPREFSLLEFFMRNPERVFPADEVISRVWSADDAATIDTLRACLSRLKKKLDTKGEPFFIENIYSVGYVLRT